MHNNTLLKLSGLRMPFVALILLSSASSQAYRASAEVTSLNGQIQISASDPRPLMQTVQAIRDQYRWLINYEDPIYSSVDLKDVSRADLGDKPGRYRRVVGGEFKVTLSTDELKRENAGATLDRIVAAYRDSAHAGHFKVSTADERFLILPSEDRTENGYVRHQAVLDSLITIEPGTRSAADTLELILAATAAKSGKRLALASGPVNPLVNTQVRIYGTATARTLLMRTLAAVNEKYVYNLLYDVNTSSYMLNVIPVK